MLQKYVLDNFYNGKVFVMGKIWISYGIYLELAMLVNFEQEM